MSSKAHSVLTGSDIHVPYFASYQNATERSIATVTTSDVGKLALQTDTNTLWLLLSETPTWTCIGGIVDGYISTSMLANESVTAEKIASSAITTAKINDSAITTAKIASNAITLDKLPSSSVFTGATSSADGTRGLVPKPESGDQNKFLMGNATWGTGSMLLMPDYDNKEEIDDVTTTYTAASNGIFYFTMWTDNNNTCTIRINNTNMGTIQMDYGTSIYQILLAKDDTIRLSKSSELAYFIPLTKTS